MVLEPAGKAGKSVTQVSTYSTEKLAAGPFRLAPGALRVLLGRSMAREIDVSKNSKSIKIYNPFQLL